jgi:Sec-independent protein secretion pathway component TatC
MNRELENLKSMSLGDHLEELRARLIMIILGVFVGLIICLFFGNKLIAIMSEPFNQVIKGLEKEGIVEIRKKQDNSNSRSDKGVSCL